jgi:hypothetical protein
MPDTIERLATCARQLLDAGAEIERLRTALRRIVSLEEKNVPKYAQQIAREALTMHDPK